MRAYFGMRLLLLPAAKESVYTTHVDATGIRPRLSPSMSAGSNECDREVSTPLRACLVDGAVGMGGSVAAVELTGAVSRYALARLRQWVM